MTEAEWLSCEVPEPMLEAIGAIRAMHEHQPTCRRMELFSCFCCRSIWELLSDQRCRELVDVIECELDGPEDTRDRWNAEDAAEKAADEMGSFASTAIWGLAHFGREATPSQVGLIADAVAEAKALAQASERDPNSPVWRAALNVEKRSQATLLRDIFGNPFRPVTLYPEWRTDTALTLARQMYESRDFFAMPILADALQDAGCDSTDVLDHCRSPGLHVRGCWVVDVVLGKE